MTNQEIEAFAYQYYDIECVKVKDINRLYKPIPIYGMTGNTAKIEHIELRSIDSLTDEELDKVAECEAISSMDVKRLKSNLGCLYSDTSDYLRSIGVAVPFRDYSVEQMIEEGKLKLKP